MYVTAWQKLTFQIRGDISPERVNPMLANFKEKLKNVCFEQDGAEVSMCDVTYLAIRVIKANRLEGTYEIRAQICGDHRDWEKNYDNSLMPTFIQLMKDIKLSFFFTKLKVLKVVEIA